MADIFVSYARVDKARVAPLVAALEAQGWSIWWDPEITGGQEFDDLIAAELEAARAAMVVWTPASVASRWVRGEARMAADRGILVPVQIGAPNLPIDARALHTIDLSSWISESAGAPLQELVRALEGLIGRPSTSTRAGRAATQATVCILPFTNMSGDREQDYFSDGISEDIITDLNKVSALSVISRKTAFAFKGQQTEIAQIAKQTGATHILEGSVRKSGNRVRISAQLTDARTDNQVWAERYDRDLADIFALQDEISSAVVAALKLKLLPEEKKALGRRGTMNAEAYRLFLLARQYLEKQSPRFLRITERLARQAIELDPNYAGAWATLGSVLRNLRNRGEPVAEDPDECIRRAIEIDPLSAEAHSAFANLLIDLGKIDEAEKEAQRAIELDSESPMAHGAFASIASMRSDHKAAAYHRERAAEIMDSDFSSLALAAQHYEVLGDTAKLKDTARKALVRIEREVSQDPANGVALALGAGMFAYLGEVERAKDWAERAALAEPDDQLTIYNLACTLVRLNEIEAALKYFEMFATKTSLYNIMWAKQDSDLDAIREEPRYKAAIAKAEARLAAQDQSGASAEPN
ncbi:MAG TPA: TIR domain-containing protein [Alphaproteobacteria bacterium]|nr:TIR domain-containing protein [Alphaproteobacteria bacterium]